MFLYYWEEFRTFQKIFVFLTLSFLEKAISLEKRRMQNLKHT